MANARTNSDEYRYTNFPNLHDVAQPNSKLKLDKHVHKFQLPEETLKDTVIFSWAQLLRGYTGASSVVFGLDDQAVCVDFEKNMVEDVAVIKSTEGILRETAIIFLESQTNFVSPAIYLQVDLYASNASLVASAFTLPGAQVLGLVSQFQQILSCQPTCPDFSIPRCPVNMRHPAEDLSDISVVNPAPIKIPGPELLHELVGFSDHHSQHTFPALNAIEFLAADGRRIGLSYERLHSLSSHFAKAIDAVIYRSAGRSPIPVLLPQSPLLYVALLAILKSGAAFVPLNLDTPKERIRFVVEDVEASIVITNSHFSDKFDWEGAPTVLKLDDDGDLSSRERWPCHPEKYPQQIAPTDPAYIMYTSGSTGKPKGVIVSHSAACQSLLAHNRHIPKFQRFLQFAAPTFDVSVFEIFFPFFRGCTLIGCDRGRLLANLPQVINDMNVDGAELTPTVAGEILGKRELVPGLKVLLTIGEMLTGRVIDEFGGGVLQGMYGPTEAAIHCTLATNFQKDAKVGDIGIPLGTVSAFIIAPAEEKKTDVEVLPVGWVGELVVGGYQLADGYLKRPDITKDVFITSKRWGPLYRTGDRARMLPSGRIECLGRVATGQVKLRGQRVELGEIEEVVLKIPSAKMAVASVVNSSLVVYVSSSGPLEMESVKQLCCRWLPSFMVPSDVVIFDDLPRLSSGKADRKLLDKQYSETSHQVNGAEDEVLSTTEKTIVDTVEEILSFRIAKNQSLSNVGLDSILAIRLATKLRAKGIKAEVLDIVSTDTIAGVSLAASSIVNRTISFAEVAAVKDRCKEILDAGKSKLRYMSLGGIDDIIPCTSLQEAMLAETVRDGDSYCNWLLLSLPSEIEVDTVKSALLSIIQRNEILRTGFLALGTGFAQVIWKKPQDSQFSISATVEKDWSISLDELLKPQFSANFVKQTNGEKVLSVRIHHAVYDGWSWENILSQFQVLLSGSQIAPIKQPQFREVVQWELAHSATQIEAAQKFWKTRLEGVSETRLPNFNGRETENTVSVEGLSLSTSRIDYEQAARNAGVSPQVLVQTAWSYLLSLYVGKDDVVFGTVVSGRTIPLEGIANIIGPTILTLPVRAQIKPGTKVDELMAHIQKFNRDLLHHTELGLREVRKVCGGELGFDSLLVWQQTANDTVEGDVRVISSRDKLEFSLLIEAEPKEGEIQLRATFKEEILPRAQVSLILRQLDRIIKEMIVDPCQILRNVVSKMEDSLLSIENPTPELVDPKSTKNLATCFEEVASKYPNFLALEFASDIRDGAAQTIKITFSELNASANQLSKELRIQGIVPDDLVAICMEKSVQCYTSILAVVKAGAGYLPLTAETPEERVSQILIAARVKILLTTQEVSIRLGEIAGVQMIDVETLDVSRHAIDNPDFCIAAQCLAYAIFTSGSTGVPKGVLVEHKQIMGNIAVLIDIYPSAPGKRLLQFCSIGFDVSVFEIFFTWACGMCLCSGTKDLLLRDIQGFINTLQITHLSMTPTVASLVNPDNVPSVEFLVTAGEALTTKVFNEWAGRGVYQGYGPSETTNICSVLSRVQKIDNISNIGPSFVNTSAFVVAADNASSLIPLPRGSVGELCFGGAQVCRGYLDMPELTAVKFVTHPKFGRIYRSGDIGRLLPSGEILIQGRLDDQIKIRGNRIELGEITFALQKQPEVLNATALVINNKDSSPQLVAFVNIKKHLGTKFQVITPEKSLQKEISAVFATIGQFLPAYMMPNTIIPVSVIPMTGQGKTDKKLLQRTFLELSPDYLESFSGGGGSSDEDSNREWTEVEQRVASVLAAVAQVNFHEITSSTSIYRLGLDSISAIQLSIRLGECGFVRPDVSQIMRNPTVPSLARILTKDAPGNSQKHAVDGTIAVEEFAQSVQTSVLEQLSYSKGDIDKILPCTPLQEAMLSVKKGVDPRGYYNHTVLSLAADADRLHDAWNTVMNVHSIMKTCFTVTSHPQHAYAQVILKEHELPWKVYEVSRPVEDLIEEYISETSSTMDTSRPPYNFGLFKSQERSTLVMSFHHSLYDGFAMNLLLQAVKNAYNGLTLPQETPFLYFLEYMESIDLTAADKFWKQMLTGLESPSFPDLTGKSNSFRKSLTGMAVQKHACSIPLSKISEGCRILSTSLQALGQTAWACILATYTGESDICFGNVVSGRTIPVDGVEKLVAPCFNTVPLRVDVLENSTNISVLESLQKVNTDIIPYQLTPLRRIMTALRTDGQGLFDTLFILQSTDGHSFEDLWEECEDRGEMDFSIVIELVPNHLNDALEILIHFRRNILLEEHAGVLLQHFDAAVNSAIKEPQSCVLSFDKFHPKLMSMANQNPKYLTSNGPALLHSEIERLAKEIPDHVALEWLNKDEKTSTWTFNEINKASNQIAHYLISLDVKRDEAIPLCIEKSPLYYICAIAVLKAGCAFTPIDPSLPEQRKSFMVQELGARYALSNTAQYQTFSNVQVVDIETLDCLSRESIANPIVGDLLDNCLAYRLYTSGSTGQPKAVSMEHRCAFQTIRQSKSIIPWTPQSRILQFAATTFDMCYYDLFMAWNYGFTLCSATASHLLGNLEQTISRMNITMLDLTPTVASTLNAKNLPNVELLYCIGEAMPAKVVNSWLGRCVNSYGPTEAAMCCTITNVRSDIKAANIGSPFDTTKFAVLSKSSPTLLPIFAAGELCIGGYQLAREYHNNTELTASRFITFNEEILYRTGDIVRQLPDGTFEFIGRVDDQVKIRGLRVELDEISTVLRESQESIRDTTTMVLKYTGDSKDQLVSFLALEDRKQHGTLPKVCLSNSLVEHARKHAQKILPRYMVPGIMLVIDHIPLSAAGKVDKKALGALFREQNINSLSHHTNDDVDEKWSESEQIIREVLSAISQVPVEQIYRSSTIYELGLDSISATQVALKLEKAGLGLSVLDILEQPSIELLSSKLNDDEIGVAKRSRALVSEFQEKYTSIITTECKLKPTAVYPCTAAQEGMLSQFLRSQGKLYFNHTLLKLSPDLEADQLRSAWQQVFESLDILRSGFVELDDNVHPFVTVKYDSDSGKLPWFSVSSQSRNLQQIISEQKEIAVLDALKNLHPPPWRVTLIQSESENYLLFSGLHVLYDATTLQIIYKDVAMYYQSGTTPKRPQFDTVLEDIVAHRLDPHTVDEDKSFWLKQLDGSSICHMPNFCPHRSSSKEYHVRSIESTWNLSDIDTTCQKLGISVHAAGQAAWARLLSAYTGETALTMGIVLSGRTGLMEADDVAFPCLVTLPSVAVLTGNNRQLALDIQASNTAALKHQHTPLRSIQRWFEHPEESFFDSIFVYQKTAGDDHSLPWSIIDEDASADYTFSLEIESTMANKLLIRATAADKIVPSQQTELMIRQFDAALIDILKNPEQSAMDLSSISSELLSVTPAAVDEIPSDVNLLHKFVEKYRELSPDKLAFEFVTAIDEDSTVTKQTWTYTQLDEEGNKVANFLLANGLRTGNIVGICFEKIPEASFAILGILKAGCAYVAIDYSAPIDRKAFIVGDSKAAMVLTQDKYVEELQAAVDARVASAESESEIHTASVETPIVADLTPDNLSYCLYTSGTTGTPKGCELTHENAVQAMLAFQRLFAGHWDTDSKWLQFASFHFDVSVLEQYWSWSVGICVTSAPRDLIFQDLAGTIDTLQITHLDLTPSLAALLSPEDVPSLCRGIFITGGEALKQEILDKWGKVGVIYNGYGPTEVTIGCTMYPRVPVNGKPSNIGPQFDNVGSYVFYPRTEKPVPRGALGELCASGKLVGCGYLNRPGLTNEKFPVLKKYKERIYRTGDLVRILHDGTFDFAGRADDQVKLRGQRLEIGEINEVVKKAPNAEIRAVATLVLRHPKQQKDQLVSFIVLGSESEIPTERGVVPIVRTKSEHAKIISLLVAACKSKLPTYMVPTHFLPVSHMPLSINNKVDNKSLKAVYEATTLDVLQQLAKVEEDKEEYWSGDEKKLRNVLVDITGMRIDQVRRSSTIFELGLDSVAVVGLARRLKKNGLGAASPSLLLQHPVLSQMAKVLSDDAGSTPSMDSARLEEIRQEISTFSSDNLDAIIRILKIDHASITKVLPCTSLQEGMIARFLDSDKLLYFNSFPMVLNNTTDLSTLKMAWKTVVASTNILRTCFCETEDGYAQVVLKDAALRWEEVELNTGSENFDDAVKQGLQHSVDRNQDLHLPPVSILIIHSSTKVMLSLNIFHTIYDGTSLPIILDDVFKAYTGALGKRSIQFSNVIPHLLTTQEGAKEFWQQNIKTSSSLPLDQLQGGQEPQDYSIEATLKNGTTQIDTVGKKLQCTAQAIFQAAWACALSTYVGSQVTLGVVVSGRSLPIEDIESVIGPTFNTVPCSVDVSVASWEQLVGEIHRFNSRSIPYHNTPLRMIHKWLKRTSDQPLFDTLFVYQKESGHVNEEEQLWKLCEASTVADYPLSLEVAQLASGDINLTVVAKAEFSKQEVSKILQDFQYQLNALLSNPSDAPLMKSELTTNDHQIQDVNNKSSSKFEWNEQACILRKTIAKLAGVREDEIEADSSILELGLDSIEAIKLSSRLRRHNIKISVSTIMRNTSISKMQQALGSERLKTPTSKATNNSIAVFENIARPQLGNMKDIEAVYPTTPLQEAMIAETLASDYTLYFNHDIMKLDPLVDVQRLKSAWMVVVKESEILRTSFFSLQNERNQQTYGQLVHRFTIPEINEFTVPEEKLMHKALDDVMQQVNKNADLLREPPVYLSLVRGPESIHMILSISHALYDGWSISLLHSDLRQAYLGRSKHRPSPRLLIENIMNTDAEGSRQFWGQLLKGAIASQIPTSKAIDTVRTHRFERVSAVSFSEVQTFCKSIGTTLQSLGKACWGLLLAHSLGETDVLFGTVLSGRDFEPAEDIMFPAMNTVPVRIMLCGSYKELLQQLQDQGSKTLKYQYTPLRDIQKLVNTGVNRLFDTLFLYQPMQSTVENQRPLYESIGGSSDVEYNIAIEMERCDKHIIWRNACKSTALELRAAEEVLERLDSLLAHIVRNPNHPALKREGDSIVIGNLPSIESRVQHTLNGVRINLDDVATAVKSGNGSIKQCAAAIVNDDGADALAAFVITLDADSAILATIEGLKTRLPHWSMPKYIVKVSEIDPEKLQTSFSALPQADKVHCATAGATGWTSLEGRIRNILATVAGLPEEEIQRTQTIFHAGLDSISAIRLSSDLRKAGIFLSVADILREATIERMALATKSSSKTSNPDLTVDTKAVVKKALHGLDLSTSVTGIPENQTETILPVTAGQLYMLSAWRNSGYTLFMPTFTFTTSAPVGLDQVRTAWESLVRQQPILRTIFRVTNNDDIPFVQIVSRNTSAQYSWYESSEAIDSELLQSIKRREQKKTVDMSLPPARLCAIKSSNKTFLFLTIHHALYDGFSLQILLSKFHQLLEHRPSRLPTPDPEGPKFPEFIALAQVQNITKQREFWTTYLQGAPSTVITWRPSKYLPHIRSSCYKPGAYPNAKLLETKCNHSGLSLQSVFLAAFARIYLQCLSCPKDDLVCGIYLSNRHFAIPDLSQMAAPTLNLVPLWIRNIRATTKLADLARQVQDDLVKIGTVENSVVDLRSIEKWTGVSVDAFFNFIKLPGGASETPPPSPSDSENSFVLASTGRKNIAIEEVEVNDDGEMLAPMGVSGFLDDKMRGLDNIRTHMDIEVAVRGNSIDVGVFANAAFFREEELGEIVKDICGVVGEV